MSNPKLLSDDYVYENKYFISRHKHKDFAMTELLSNRNNVYDQTNVKLPEISKFNLMKQKAKDKFGDLLAFQETLNKDAAVYFNDRAKSITKKNEYKSSGVGDTKRR